MNIRNRRTIATLALALLFPAGALFAQTSSPFLPAAGQGDVSVTYAYQGLRDYKAGGVDNPDESLPATLSQNTVFVNGDYGLSNRVAFDFLSGYTRSSLQSSVSDGAADTTLGVRFVLHQWEHVTLTGRTDAIIAGSYPLSSLGPFAAGLGANGFLGSVLVGVTGPHGVSLSLENAYKAYSSPVPDVFFSSATFNQSIGRFYYLGGFEEDRSLSGVSLSDPTFVPSEFNQLKATEGDIVAGFGINQRDGLSYGFTYDRWLHGSNTGKKHVFALTIGYHFGGTGPHF
jgi:hypothetical protein